MGRLAENIVYLTLKRKQVLYPQKELFYWKDDQHREVDFIAKDGLNITNLIQVCWNINDERTKKRELVSLQKAMEKLKNANALIITGDTEGEVTLNGYKVKTVPLWKWLLSEEGIGL